MNMGESGMRFRDHRLKQTIAAAFIFTAMGPLASAAQQPDSASVIQQVDAAVKSRNDHIAAYTVTERYAVYRGKDETHPAAEMTVHTTYRKGLGKSYAIVSESGSEFIRKHVLSKLLDNEKEISRAGNRERSWFVSANRDGSIVHIEGTASQSPSVFTEPAKVMRQYARVNGFGMATHAKAVSDSFLLGQTTVTIDYRDYQIQLRPAN
jgi:hypothetical protein